MDVHDSVTRSYNMSRIRSKNTKPEILVRKYLFKIGLRYRLHDKKLPGKPDIVFSRYKTVIMVNGCFWHGHEGCKYFVLPKTRSEWWLNKINTTKERDFQNKQELKSLGWKVIEIFECELKADKRNSTLIYLTKTLTENGRNS